MSIGTATSLVTKLCFSKETVKAIARSHVIMNGQSRRSHEHDTHATPPQAIYNVYKKYQKMDDVAVDGDLDVVDFRRGLTAKQKERIVPVDTVKSEIIASAQKSFRESSCAGDDQAEDLIPPAPCTIYEHKDFNGLRLLPSLLPPECQFLMLSSLLHRDLANPLHTTNLTHDYNIPFPSTPPNSRHPPSFFTYAHSSRDKVFTPLNPNSNMKPLNTTQFLQKRLRWLTFGSQYNWQTRSYPKDSPALFPPDIAALVTELFNKAFVPESGVVLLYSPKDYMPVHRDVSEECERGLASFTLGCDGLFIIARDKEGEDEENVDREQETVVLRVRSGDVVQMGGKTRWAWHAMPKVMAGTCPEELQDWPVGKGTPKEYEKWRGFMAGKRLNISCRQVWGN